MLCLWCFFIAIETLRRSRGPSYFIVQSDTCESLKLTSCIGISAREGIPITTDSGVPKWHWLATGSSCFSHTLASSPSDGVLWVLTQSTHSSKVTHTAIRLPGGLVHAGPCVTFPPYACCLMGHHATTFSGLWGNGPMRGCYTLAVTGRNFCQQNKGLSISSGILSLLMLSYTSSFSTFLQTLPLSLRFRYSSWVVSVVTALASWALRCLSCISTWVLRTADPPFILFIHLFIFLFFGLLRHVLLCSAGCPGTMKVKLAFNSLRSASRCLWSTGIRGVCYDHWFCKWLFIHVKPV